MKKLGIFGGSFDPIHNGHLKLAAAAKKEYALDKIFFVPAKLPPHKRKRTLADEKSRLRMIKLAIKPFGAFGLSRFEIKRNTVTYTYTTVQHFKKKYPGSAIFFIIGSDSLNELRTWKNIKKLLSMCIFIVAKRKGFLPRKTNRFVKHCLFTHRPIKNISSTEIRKRVKLGLSIRNMVPAKISNYILAKGLYK